MCRVLLGMQSGKPHDAGGVPLVADALSETEGTQAAVLREALEAVLDARAEQETLSVDVVVEAVTDLLMRTVMRVTRQLVDAGDTDATRMKLVACCRLVQRSLDVLAWGEGEDGDGI